jgi:L-lactate dehydrogenase complex protein LldF
MRVSHSFPVAARAALSDTQLRRNLGKAVTTIRVKRAAAVSELDDWEALRAAGAALKDRALATLPEQLERLEASVTRAGGTVHWARDGAEANAIVAGIAREQGANEVLKVKSMATDEIGLNEALALRGIRAVETDLAELIVQLGDDEPSHILVPAIHKNRAEIAALFERTIAPGQTLGLDAPAIAEAARRHLREKFLTVPVAVSGANFGVAETGTICVVESEGNGRMCTTLPRVLVTVMGIEKVVPEWRDLEVMLQLLPRSSTAERMNPYTSLWTGVRDGDGPHEFHLVLLDGGRTDVLADEVGRQALRCIRCSACLNVCPVYARTGGHAYESVYPGPIGAILTPQLLGLERAQTLPWASTLCGACYEVCPVRIDIPEVLVHLRGRVVREVKSRWSAERLAMDAVSRVFRSRGSYERAQRLARAGRGPLTAPVGPMRGWTAMRDLPEVPAQTFREWWASREPPPRGLSDGPEVAWDGGAPTGGRGLSDGPEAG